jgi:hypothetical protein
MTDIPEIEAPSELEAEAAGSEWRLLHAERPICGHAGVISNRLAPTRKVTCSACGTRAAMSNIAAGMVGFPRQPKSRGR